MDSKSLAKHLVFLILAIFVANFIANKLYLYSSVWYFDMIMHFVGGFWIGLLIIYLYKADKISFRFLLTTLVWVLVIGAGWEIFELFVDKRFSQNLFNPLDTSSDIFFDLSGGVFAIFYNFRKIGFLK